MTQKNRAGVMLDAARATLLLSLLEPDKTLRECAVAALAESLETFLMNVLLDAEHVDNTLTLEGIAALETGVLELARSLLAEALDTTPWSDWLPSEAVQALERQRDEREQGATAP